MTHAPKTRRRNGSPLGRGVCLGLSALFLAAALTGCSSAPREQETAIDDDRLYSFWPPLPHEPRIQFLTSYRFSTDVEPEQSGLDKLVFGKEQTVLPIAKPYGVEMYDGKIYVCDVTNPGIMVLDLRNQQTLLMGVSGANRMSQPVDLAIAPDGTKYVVDRVLERIFVFDRNDRNVMTFNPEGAVPVGIAVRGDDLLVADFESQTVLVMDRFTGEIKGSIGKPGGGDGAFIRPLGVAVDERGDVYVTDVIQGKLQEFAPDGSLVMAVGQIADTAGDFVRPKHLDVGKDGVIYVVDSAFQNVQMFNQDGEILMYFGSPGDHAGSMSLPAGLAVPDGDLDLFEQYVHPAFQAEQLILVTNQFGLHKVSVYAYGKLKPGRTVSDIAPNIADIGTGEWTDDRRDRPAPVTGDEQPETTTEEAVEQSGQEG